MFAPQIERRANFVRSGNFFWKRARKIFRIYFERANRYVFVVEDNRERRRARKKILVRNSRENRRKSRRISMQEVILKMRKDLRNVERIMLSFVACDKRVAKLSFVTVMSTP